jgi:hypothetical protein
MKPFETFPLDISEFKPLRLGSGPKRVALIVLSFPAEVSNPNNINNPLGGVLGGELGTVRVVIADHTSVRRPANYMGYLPSDVDVEVFSAYP